MTAEQTPAYTFAAITPDNVTTIWPQIEPLIADALKHDYDGMTTRQVLGRVLMMELTLLVVAKADEIVAAVTLEQAQRQHTICHCMTFAGSDMSEWCDEFMAVWKQIARQTGARYLSIKGRRGWERYAAKHYGFKHAYTQMYYDLEGDDDER